MVGTPRRGGPKAPPPRGRFTIVYLIHEAFRRDLARLRDAARATEPGTPTSRRLKAHWVFVNDQLHHHHEVEDASLWPLVRPKLAGQGDDLAVLDKMETQHAALEPECAAITESLESWCEGGTSEDTTNLIEHLDALSSLLSRHLDDEEALAFPVIDRAMGEAEFEAFGKATAKSVGIRGSAQFFPWIFDGAQPVERDAVLSLPPPPVRVLCGLFWEPRYQRRSALLWAT